MALDRKQALPTWRDLPVDDGVPMENFNHPIQAQKYLKEPLQKFLAEQGMSAFTGSNGFLYYAQGVPAIGPDFFVVNDGVDSGQGSWVVYSEGNRFPTLVCELLSPSTEQYDRNGKKTLYQDALRTPDYFTYD